MGRGGGVTMFQDRAAIRVSNVSNDDVDLERQ